VVGRLDANIGSVSATGNRILYTYGAGGSEFLRVVLPFCDVPVPVRLPVFEGVWKKDHVELRWEAGEDFNERLVLTGRSRAATWFVPLQAPERNAGWAWDWQAAAYGGTRVTYTLSLPHVGGDRHEPLGECVVPIPGLPLRIEASPNPFRQHLQIRLSGPAGTAVTVSVHDLTGAKVRTLVQDGTALGTHVWDGRDDFGRPVSSGAYFLIAKGPAGAVSQKVLHLMP
jgi:hypothetical protein